MRSHLKLRICAALLTLSLASPASAELYCPEAANRDWWTGLTTDRLVFCLGSGSLQGRDIDGVDEDGLTLLGNALGNGASGAQIKAILDAGADPNRSAPGEWQQMTPLMMEVFLPSEYSKPAEDSLARVEALLEAGADPNATDVDGWPAFSYQMGFVQPPDPAVIDRLLDAGADFTMPMPEGNGNILFIALASGNGLEFVQRLQKLSGASYLTTDGQGRTLLHMLYRHEIASGKNVVDFLLAAGVDPARRSDGGKLAWEEIANTNPGLAAYMRRAAGTPLPDLPTSEEMAALCRREFVASRVSIEPGLSAADVCTCVGAHAPDMYDRISDSPNFHRVYPPEMSQQDRLQTLLNPLMMGCLILNTRTP